jgi:hypothetical protein
VFSGTYGSTAMSDTGHAPHLNGAQVAPPLTPAKNNKEAGMANGASDDQDKPGIGHNSAIHRDAWHTPSRQTFDEVAAASAGPGRNLHRLRVLQSAIFDTRLGVAPLPLKLLSAVLDHANRETGTAYPGTKALAEEIHHDLQKVPPDERVDALDKAANVIMNMFTLLKQCGYDVSTRRAPPGGGRAVAHHALTYPDREEMLAAIAVHERWQEQENARRAEAKKKAGSPHVAHEVNSPHVAHEVSDLTRHMRSEGADLTCTGFLTSRVPAQNDHSLSITEPISINLHAGADAPGGLRGEEGFSEGAVPDGAPTSGKDAPCKPKSLVEADDDVEVELSPAAQEALDAFNAAAATHGFTPCRSPTDTQANRLGKRLKGIGGVRRFKRALGALPLDDFLMGRIKPKDGGKPFRLNLDRLLRTDGPMGDVLGRLLGLADEAGAATPGAPADPDAALKHLVASPFGQRTLERHGQDEGMKILRARIAASGGASNA